MLPWQIKGIVLLGFDYFKSCDALILWIKSKVRITTSWRPGGTTAAHALEQLDDEAEQELAALGEGVTEDEINVVFRRGHARFAKNKWPQRIWRQPCGASRAASAASGG